MKGRHSGRIVPAAALCLLLAVSSTVLGEHADGEQGGWDYSLGFHERLRYESKKDFDFDKSISDKGGLIFHRLTFNNRLSWADPDGPERFAVFVEGLDAQTGSHQIKAVSTQTDDFDLHQAYLYGEHLWGWPVDVKLGRQEMHFGKGRLISQPSWGNRIRTFDAAMVRLHHGGLGGDFFYAQDVKYDDNNFNRSLDEEFVAGVYGSYQKEKGAPPFDGYFLTQVISTSDALTRRYTVGIRAQMSLWAGIVMDLEAPYQFGEAATKDIRAWAFHCDVVRDFEDLTWKPKVTGEYNVASGDKDPNDSVNNTFVPLYQGTHSPYGILDFFRWQNMREVALNVALSPTKELKLIPQTNFFWLESKFDSWYNSSGTPLRSKTSGDRGYYVGQELSLTAKYPFTKNITCEIGYAHFLTGDYVRDSGADDDADWVYTQVAVKW